MSRFTKFTLLTLAAFLVLGFSITANAAKPDKLQVMRSAAVTGYYHICNATNVSGRNIEVTFKIYHHTGTFQTQSDEVLAGYTLSYPVADSATSRCELSWWGQPDEFIASYCNYFGADPADTTVCFELF